MPILNMIAQGSGGGGGGNNVGEPTNLSAFSTSNSSVDIRWTDNNLQALPPSTFGKSVLVRKVGSAPTTPSDGTTVVTETVMNTYQSSAYTDTGLTQGTTYYYQVFSYSTDGGITYGTPASATPSSGWQPGADTIAYYPLDSTNTVNDLSGNGYTLTNPDDEIAFNTYQGVDCAYFYKTNFYNVLGRTEAEQIIPTGDFTWNAFLYVLNEYQASPRIFRDYSGNQSQGFVIYNGKLVYQDVSSSVGIPLSYDSWHLYTITGNFTNGTFSFYLDGVLQGTATGNRLPGTGIFWGSGIMSGYSQQTDKYCGGMSKVVLEDRIRTGQEILDYLEQNKTDYGIS